MLKRNYFLFFSMIICGDTKTYQNMQTSSMPILFRLMNTATDNAKFKIGNSYDLKKHQPSIGLEFKITSDKNLNKNRDTVIGFSISELFRKDDFKYLEYVNKENKINSKSEFVGLNDKEILSIIANLDEKKSAAFFDNLCAEMYENTHIGKIFKVVNKISMKSYSDEGFVVEYAIQSYRDGGIFEQVGEFKYLSALFLGAEYFSGNPTAMFGTAQIFNNKHILGIKFLSDIEKWNSILSHVLPVESLKVVPYFAASLFNGNFKFLVSSVFSYNYDKAKLISLYKNYTTEVEKDVELKTEDNGKLNYLIPVSLEFFSILQLEAIFKSSKDYTLLGKIDLSKIINTILNSKKFKISLVAHNSTVLKDTKNESKKEDWDFGQISNVFEKFEKLNLSFTIEYTGDLGTFTLKWKATPYAENFSFNPFSTSNANWNKDLLKYVVSSIKISWKYETKKKENNKEDVHLFAQTYA